MMKPSDLIEEHEGRIPWMYLDTVGKVTVGVGECLETAAEASEVFGFDVSRDFARVQGMPKGMPAPKYQYPGCPTLHDAQIDALRDRSILRSVTVVRNLMNNYDQLADARKAVLVSMAFNLGAKGLANFRHMLAFVNWEQWDQAADAMLDSLWARQLPARAKQHADLMRKGDL